MWRRPKNNTPVIDPDSAQFSGWQEDFDHPIGDPTGIRLEPDRHGSGDGFTSGDREPSVVLRAFDLAVDHESFGKIGFEIGRAHV